MNFYPIKHWFHSIKTISYWRYLLSIDSFKTFFSAWGVIWLAIETAEYFKLFDVAVLKSYGLYFLIFAVFLVIWTRRPLTKICYKLPDRDVKIEIRVADIFNVPGEIVISTNTTFDTDTSSGLISSNSLQGKFTKEFYDGNFQHLNGDLDRALATTASQPVTGPGKLKKYEIGSVAKITIKGRIFYLLAMADMNQHGNAQSSKTLIKQALKGLWDFILQKGELGNVAIPLLGTGRGRVNATREETIKMIVTSFAQAIQQRRFANKLTIVISPSDYREHELNLFELNDYLRAVHRYERLE